MKKKFIILFGIIIVVIFAFIFKNMYTSESEYKIIPEKSDFEDEILRIINRPKVVSNNIDTKKELNLDNMKYILYEFGESKGFAEFKKGINKKYKVGRVGYGTSMTKNEIIKTNKGKYIFIAFINRNNKVKYVTVLFDNQEYRIDIPKEEYVIAYCKAPKNSEVAAIDIKKIKFFNDKNIDISQEVLFEQ